MQVAIKKELETINRNQEKLENSLARTKTEVKAMNSRINKKNEYLTWKIEYENCPIRAADRKPNEKKGPVG